MTLGALALRKRNSSRISTRGYFLKLPHIEEIEIKANRGFSKP
jgi:hypothetical protein